MCSKYLRKTTNSCWTNSMGLFVHFYITQWFILPQSADFLSVISGHMRIVSSNERRHCICNVFSHWLRPFSGDLRHLIENRFLVLLSPFHDNVIKWKHSLHYWPSVMGIHCSLVDSPHKSQWHRALVFSLVCACINGWVNNWDACDLRCPHTHYDVAVMFFQNIHIR